MSATGVFILDVDGQRLVIDVPELPGETAATKAEVQGVLDSIRIAPANPPTPKSFLKGRHVMRTRLFFAMPIALAAAVIIGGVALATTAVGVTSTHGTLDPVNIHVKNGHWMTKLQIKGQSSVSVVQNTVIPGGTFGWHSHPGPSLIIVKSGTITFYHGDDPTRTPDVKHAGDALIDDGTDVHVGRNEGTTDAVVIVTRFLPVGAPTRIDEPANPFCGF